MNKWILLLSVLCLSACGGSGGNGSKTGSVPPPAPASPPATATTPLNSSCLQGNAYCDNSVYNQQGWVAYPNTSYQNYRGYYNFCSCPNGYMPAYNGSIGVGCVQSNYVPRQIVYKWQFKWKKQSSSKHQSVYYYANGNGANLGQQSNTNPQNNNCQSNVAQSCFVEQPNSCNNGGYCQATGAGTLGICVNQTSNGGSGR